jgi:hypothetical protein
MPTRLIEDHRYVLVFSDGFGKAVEEGLHRRRIGIGHHQCKGIVAFFRTYYGPMHKAFLALDHSGQAALASDLEATVARFNTTTDGSMRAPSDYAEIVISKA